MTRVIEVKALDQKRQKNTQELKDRRRAKSSNEDLKKREGLKERGINILKHSRESTGEIQKLTARER